MHLSAMRATSCASEIRLRLAVQYIFTKIQADCVACRRRQQSHRGSSSAYNATDSCTIHRLRKTEIVDVSQQAHAFEFCMQSSTSIFMQEKLFVRITEQKLIASEFHPSHERENIRICCSTFCVNGIKEHLLFPVVCSFDATTTTTTTTTSPSTTHPCVRIVQARPFASIRILCCACFPSDTNNHWDMVAALFKHHRARSMIRFSVERYKLRWIKLDAYPRALEISARLIVDVLS